MSFLRENRAIIDAEDGEIIFKAPSPLLQATINYSVLVPAYSNLVVTASIPEPVLETHVLNNTSSLGLKYGIYVAQGLVDVSSSEFKVFLSNLTDKPQLLEAKTCVGYLSFAKEYEIGHNYALNGFFEDNPCQNLQIAVDQKSNSREVHLAPMMNNYIKNTEYFKDNNQFISNQSEVLFKELDLNKDSLTEEQIIKAKLLIEENIDLFSAKNPGATDLVTHRIDVGQNCPISQMPYRVSPKERNIIESEVQRMLDENIIEPSQSPWASPVVLVSKKDGSVRFCVDYRRLNLLTTKDVYPLPRIYDFLAAPHGGKFFSTLDLTSGYHQIPMDPLSKDKTAFISVAGLFQFKVLPFGLTNAPATFQRFMDAVLAGLKWKNLLVYMDDICVFSSSFNDHMSDLKSVFDRIRQAKLKLKPSKCHLFQNQIKFLGHIVTDKGILPDPDKVKAINEMPIPTNVTKLQSFLGLVGYYRKFICDFSRICIGLYDLTKIGKE